MQENSKRQNRGEIKGGQLGEKLGEKVGEKVGEKTGESLGEIDKLNLCLIFYGYQIFPGKIQTKLKFRECFRNTIPRAL